MPIKSYVLIPQQDKTTQLLQELSLIEQCESQVAENKDVIVAVTDTPSEVADKELYKQIEQLPSLAHITLVSGFND
ncbi:MAG: hypothetical protein JXQ90_02535 [Cyclobacteriaceae bacterium]